MLRPLPFCAALAGALLALAPLPAYAAPIEQAGWAARKRTAALPNGVTLAYVELGDPKGAPVMLLHGWTDTSRSWSILAPFIARRRVIIPDLRGHGGSSKPDCCYALSDLAHDVTLLMDRLGVERAAFAGHSLGSMIAQQLAAEQPERVTRVALLGSTALAPFRQGDPLRSLLLSLQSPPAPGEPFFEEWIANPTPVSPAFLAQLRPETASVPLHVWREIPEELTELPIGRFAPAVKAPVLILAGGKDPLFGAAHQAALRKAYPNAAFRLFPALGHNLLWETPEEVGPVLAAFLAG